MHEHIVAIGKAGTISDVCDHALEAASKCGATRMSYHITPRFEQQNSPDVVLCAHGFPPNFVELYEDSDYRRRDPIPDHIMRAGHAMRLADAMEEIRENGIDAREFFDALDEFDLLPAIGIPLFGPKSRDGFAGFGFPSDFGDISDNVIATLTAVMQAAHRRIAGIVDEMDGSVELSQREAQVLASIAKGSSNSEIASDLGISADTVATYVKRIFAKLETNDRVGATVKGLKLGLISA